MSAPLSSRSKLGAPIEKVVGQKLKPAIGKSREWLPSNVASIEQADGPYLEHAIPDLRRHDPATDVAPGNNGTHDINNQIIAEAYGSGLRVRFRKKIVR